MDSILVWAGLSLAVGAVIRFQYKKALTWAICIPAVLIIFSQTHNVLLPILSIISIWATEISIFVFKKFNDTIAQLAEKISKSGVVMIFSVGVIGGVIIGTSLGIKVIVQIVFVCLEFFGTALAINIIGKSKQVEGIS